MRIPKYLSHSSLSLFLKDREEFYIRHLADKRAPRLPQEQFMSIGSAFDARVKSYLHRILFGSTHADSAKFEFDALFTSQVEEHNRDWAKAEAEYVFDCYAACGALQDLVLDLEGAVEEPRFEFSVESLLGGVVPFMGKPDLRYVHRTGVHVIFDWKVKGYCSKYGASPTKNYRLCRDALPEGAQQGKPSRSNGKMHAGYLTCDHNGFEVNAVGFEVASTEYADQLSVYGWMLGEQIGDDKVAFCIDEIVGKYMGEGVRPILRVANHRARVGRVYQQALYERACKAWEAITGGHIFYEMTRAESDDRCEVLEQTAAGLQAVGGSDDWFNEVTRPRFRK